ncbi:MAG: serine/threonine-protein kinase [Deltaproteobacteria bacterium]|nr:serine/threonine-protein kinase [Deltaproteobacteria bacterium]
MDRYVVLEQVGAGGMGVVHRAYDPKLRREVALKMLRFDRREGSGAMRAETRILREARAMAQLSHPHVLPVYDVEHVGGLVYIAMEYVDGQTLSRWMRRETRPWSDVVAVFVQAGEGLHAAHIEGIIHRDFKPSNVLMGNKGRVLVTDFGLARAHDDDHDDMADMWSSGDHGTGEEITESGEVVGTPAYMAPEQLRGELVDARADQYAFCIALFEGLFGRRPFAQKETRPLLAAKEAARIEPDPGTTVPTWLFRIIERGLKPRPDDRFASMVELLQALRHDPAQARRRWVWLGAGATTGAAVLGLQLVSDDPEAPCLTVDAMEQQLWNDALRDDVRGALLATKQGYAADTAQRVTTLLADYAHRWSVAHVGACEATHVRRDQSAEAFDLTMACLRRHRAELETTVETLGSEVDASTLQRATALVAALPNPDLCADIEALRTRGRTIDPRDAAIIEQERERLARATALARAWRTERARTLANAIDERVSGLGDPTMRADVGLLHGLLARQSSEMDEAERWYRRAFADAVEARDPVAAVEAGTQLIQTVGIRQTRTAEGELWVEHTRSWLRGTAAAHDSRAARVSMAEGELFRAAGRFDESRIAFSRAVEQLDGQDQSPDLADAHRLLGLSLMVLGEVEAAQIEFSLVLGLRQQLLGPSHPEVARAHQNLGGALYTAGRLSRALSHYEKALAILEQALGPEHPRLIAALDNLGALRDDLGEHEDAREHFERALRLLDANESAGPREKVSLRRNLAAALDHAGDHEGAVERLQQAAEIIEQTYGSTHPDHVELLASTGRVLAAAGKPARALEFLEQANAVRIRLPAEAATISADVARALGRVVGQQGDHPRALKLLTEAVALYRSQGEAVDPLRGQAMLDLGELQLAASQRSAAADTLDAAIPLLTTPQVPAEVLARARFGLARAVGATDAARARRLAEDARVGLDEEDLLRTEVEHWLAEQAP